MNLVVREVMLGALTVAIAAAILTPAFLVLNMLMNSGLEVAFVAVVVTGLSFAFLLHHETRGS